MGFDYSSTIDTSFSLQIQHDGNVDGDWTRTHFYSLITSSPYNMIWPYINNFEMKEDDNYTDFKLNFGTSTDTAEITVDNVFLVEMDIEGDFLETGYWEILKEDDWGLIRMSPYDYLKDDNDVDIDGEHEAYMVNAFLRIMDNAMRLYYKFDFIDPGDPAGSSITDLYPTMFVYNSNKDIPYNKTGNSFTVDSEYFEDGDIFWSCFDNYMLTVSTNTTYVYKRTTEAAVTDADDNTEFIPPYEY